MRSVFGDAKIASVTLKNKIIRSATHEGMADKNGCPTEMLMKKYELLARGEEGAIITGYAAIQQNGKSPMHNMLMIDNDLRIEPFRKLTRRVHEYEVPVFLQIALAGGKLAPKLQASQRLLLLLSGIKCIARRYRMLYRKLR